MTGEKVDAQSALASGLVNRVVSEEALQSETMALANQLAQGPTKAIGLMKRATNRGLDLNIDDFLDLEADLQELAGRTTDYQEGVSAFMEKRQPAFSGK